MRIAPFAIGLALIAGLEQGLAQVPETSDEELRTFNPSKAVVLMDVYWNRVWKCGRFENAQLRSLTFEKLPLASGTDSPNTRLVLENPSRLSPPQRFIPYALIVEPGEYDLTAFEVGYARSMRDVGSTVATRSSTVKDGRSHLGKFSAAAGEVVYIGNFAVDCYRDPIPWRYYTEGRTDFDKHLEQYKAKYPSLKTESTVYRLFETKELGQPYELR